MPSHPNRLHQTVSGGVVMSVSVKCSSGTMWNLRVRVLSFWGGQSSRLRAQGLGRLGFKVWSLGLAYRITIASFRTTCIEAHFGLRVQRLRLGF